MIKSFFLVIFFLMGTCPLRADGVLASDQEFLKELNVIKNPFEDGRPKPMVIIQKPIIPRKVYQKPKIVIPKPKPVEVKIELPELKLQGVMVGEDGGMQQAIINDQVVPLKGIIMGARVVAVNKDGVYLSFKGKKFFLKVD